MKLHILSPDDKGRINGTIHENLLKYFSIQVSSISDSDLCVIPISFFHDYKFNPKILDVNKPYILIDYMEYEWNYFHKKKVTHLFGINTELCPWLNPAWYPFDEWVRRNPPKIYFKRELLQQDVTSVVRPLDWPCYMEERPAQSEDEFNARRLEVFNIWGYSNPCRPKLHGDIFHGMATHGLGVISALDQYEGHFRDNSHSKTWMTVFTPWHTRKPINDLRWFQEQSKLSVSLHGCGIKCFRHSESPVASIMALQEDDMAWSYPWIHGENCIRLRQGHEFEDLEAATHRTDLYKIYLGSHSTIDRYRGERYVKEYIMSLIQ